MPHTSPEVQIRPARPEDADTCGRICYEAFAKINGSHNFPVDFPNPEIPTAFISHVFSDPHFYCVVAEHEGRIIGSNCMDERSVIFGIGPVTIDPNVQNIGIGRKLMAAVMDRAQERRASGVRLVQAAFHNRSLALYTTLGFDTREPLSMVQGRATQRNVPGCSVRPAQLDDLAACNAISHQVHGFDRSTELAQGIEQNTALVVERGGHISGYASSLAFFGYAIAENNTDMQALIASVESFGGPGILVPTRNSALLRWCLENGLRIVQPMTLMTTGLYNEPTGAWLPSVLF
jgi:predicted N-acetyltransferase YhbS